MRRKLAVTLISLIVLSGLSFQSGRVSLAAVSVQSLSGRILLQVESHGEAWYVSPIDLKRYYLGRPDDAFNILRSFGLGISESDFTQVQTALPSRLYGRILLRVQKNGEAYYADPVSRQLYYLGRPQDAFDILRSRGLGISNGNIGQIPIGENLVSPPYDSHHSRTFSFEYRGDNYSISLAMDEALYNYYRQLPKLVYYSGEESSAVRDSFYALFLKTKADDSSIVALAGSLRQIASDNGWDGEGLAELALAFVQSIPYDHDKAGSSSFTPNMPYETLYLNKGVCSEKVFLGVLLLRELGYGAAVLDFPESNHSALGIRCDSSLSTSGSGYCYGETTNRLPFAAVPPSLSGGQASTGSTWAKIAGASQLGSMEVYQESGGESYDPSITLILASQIGTKETQMASLKGEIDIEQDALTRDEAALAQKKADIDYYYNQGDTTNYKAAVQEYNTLVAQFNVRVADYEAKIKEYNALVAAYNSQIKQFYWHQ